MERQLTSVTTNPLAPTSPRPIWSAMMLEFPCAIFANGPACTSTGVSSRVCTNARILTSFEKQSQSIPDHGKETSGCNKGDSTSVKDEAKK